MLSASIQREQCAREDDDRLARHDREIRAVACAALKIPFGPVRVGGGYRRQADGEDLSGNPTAWDMTDNHDAIVPWYMRH